MRKLPWLIAAVLLASPLALADNDEDDGDEKNEKGHERDEGDHRVMHFDLDDDKATFRLKRESNGTEDSVKIEFDARHAKLVVKHEEETGENETERKLDARFLALVEFADSDGDGAYDPGEPIASAWSLGEKRRDAKVPTNGSVEWGPIGVSDVTSGNATGKKLSSRASFGPNATFGLDLFVYGAFATAGNASLLPTEAKIDIIIQHYPYVRNDTALAVLVDLKSKEEFESDDDEDEGEDGVGSDGSSGNLTLSLVFTWLETATVDGVERAVQSTVMKSREESDEDGLSQKARVALAYPRGDLIVHDPTVGVQYETASDSARAVPFPALGLVVAAAVLVGAMKKKR